MYNLMISKLLDALKEGKATKITYKGQRSKAEDEYKKHSVRKTYRTVHETGFHFVHQMQSKGESVVSSCEGV
jgi:hypothetical protein